MSDSGFHRRQPPSPLVFSPETVLPPIGNQATASTSSHHASSSNTVSMPFVRRHVMRRLKTAKAECDKELQRVTNSITAFFEERLREEEALREVEREARGRERERGRSSQVDYDSQRSESESFEQYYLNPSDLIVPSDDYSSDGGYDAEVDSGRHSRQRASLEEALARPPILTHSSSSPGLLLASASSSSASNTLRRQNTTGTLSESRKQQNAIAPSWSSGSTVSRRLSRTIHIPGRAPPSVASSRSTSRSRSPLPRTNYGSFSETLGSPNNRRASRILVDDPVEPIMVALYDLIALATEVMDMSIAQLTSQPKICESLVQRVQAIGKAWEEHPDWHGRNWYVQVLLAVASLSRVVEWWEAEKQFWNFDDNENEEDEPLTFVLKPAQEEKPISPTSHPKEAHLPEPSAFKLSPEDEAKLRVTRTTSYNRRSRDEATKDISTVPTPQKDDDHEHSKGHDVAESARVLATERLRLQAETAQNRNIVLELDLDGDHIQWINYAWRTVVGTEPEELFESRISRLLALSDWGLFKEATRRLQEDDSHTVSVTFKLQVQPEDDRDGASGVLFQQMEGQGMLIVDREEGRATHTMWVIKPVGSPQWQHTPSIMLETGEVGDEPLPAEALKDFSERGTFEPVTPFPLVRPINATPILCRICECNIPQWFFEKHNETCSEVHRLEAEIAECNESIMELRNTIRELLAGVDRSSSRTPPEYRGMPLFSPSSSPVSHSPLQLFRGPLASKMQRMGVKKMQRRVLEQLEDILLVASEISVPALKEEEQKEPIERQRLLSPSSERKMTQVRGWIKPATQDAALCQLIEDAERVMRQKTDNVIRMQNTIKYSEKIRQEWEEKVEMTLASVEEADMEGGEEEEGHDEGKESEDHSSTTSEYAFKGDEPSFDPTPVAPASPATFARTEVTEKPPPPSTEMIPTLAPSPVPAYHPPIFGQMYTRSSTPSSISSPLALAAPIVASASSEDTPPPIDLNEDAMQTVKKRKSAQNLEPNVHGTPPLSPLLSPRETPALQRSRRRHSTAQPILSPTTSAPGPLSPRLPSVAPLSRSNPTSIKDFDIIKPISKGAFGSVFLAKKKVTGDYYAIKVLKKADMIAKNQITNVKAERMILMKQAESPFVAKLFFTFQSKENLYLVMEYLNGGDCAALLKSLGSLPEEWAKNYVAEVVLALEYLHSQGIVHRDLKPDNLLIDQQGHLKLTDFGLSRIGLLGRQTREGQYLLERGLRPRARHSPGSRPPSMDAIYLASPLSSADLFAGGSYFSQRTNPVPRLATSPYTPSSDDISESSGSESVPGFARRTGNRGNDSPLQSFAAELTTDLRSHSGVNTPPGEQKFVGTPDYLAPETILGLRGDDAAVDWWALGVITYEFLYGLPPFHAETPEKVFENILSGHIEWHEDWIEFSDEARDFMERLMTLDPSRRLGAHGASEVKNHPWFHDIEWDKVTTSEAAFIPQVTDPESTDYFDPRGAIPALFHEDEAVAVSGQPSRESPAVSPEPGAHSTTAPVPIMGNREMVAAPDEDFGAFSFKNLPVLKQANDEVIRKLRSDQMAPLAHTLSDPTNMHSRKRSISQRVKKPPSVVTALDTKNMPTSPPSPATSTSSIASSPSRGSIPPSTPGSGTHARKPSEYTTVERFKFNHWDGDGLRRNSMPSRLRTASVSSGGDGSATSETWQSSVGQSSTQYEATTPPSSVASMELKQSSIDLKRAPDPNDRAVTCLVADDNPITAKIIETLLIRLGCRCYVVADGSEAISVAMGDIKFDCILMDLHMPVLDGEGAARYIKNTSGKNTNTPIIAVSAYSGNEPHEPNHLFAAYLSKPVQKADLLTVMRQVGFKTSTVQEGGPRATKVTPASTTLAAQP